MSGGAEGLLELWRAALLTAAMVIAPFVLAVLAVGVVVAIVQTATQLQESVLVFAPKLAAALLVTALAGHWLLDRLQAFSLRSFSHAAAPSVDDEAAEAPPW